MNINTENLDTTIEHWASIDGYLNYQVSWWGRVENTKTGRILKPGAARGICLWRCAETELEKYIIYTNSLPASGSPIQKKRNVSTTAMATAQTITSKTFDMPRTRKTTDTEAREQTPHQCIMG